MSNRSLGCLNVAMLVPRDRPTTLAPRACRGTNALVLVSSLADILGDDGFEKGREFHDLYLLGMGILQVVELAVCWF